RVEVIATADVGDQSAAGFNVGVAVDVDEPGNDELAAGVDATIDGPGEGPSDERHAVVLEDEHATAQQPVPTVTVGDDVAALAQRLHGCLLDPRSQSSLSSASHGHTRRSTSDTAPKRRMAITESSSMELNASSVFQYEVAERIT